jgi:hypothetical protein
VIRHGNAASQDVIVGNLDFIQDAAIEPACGRHASPRDRGKHGDARDRPAVDGPSACHQICQSLPHPTIRPPGAAAPAEQLPVHAE